jgi:hypothetical protein
MKKTVLAVPWLLLMFQAGAFARGVSPYLPLNLEPEMEAAVERVLILGDQPVMSRPIAAATVLAALPKACTIDQALCERVQRYLARFTPVSNLTHLSVEGAVTNGSDVSLPNRYGMGSRSQWAASGDVYLQPSDYLLFSAGIAAYHGTTDYTGSMISVGFDWTQLDVGFRPHWFSPMSDSSLLMSTQAPTMPSVTLSNYRPLTRLGLRYEFFDARMSNSDHIVTQDANGNYSFTSGHPLLAGFHIAMEPVSGWSLGANRLMQYGGDGRPSSFKDLFKAFFNPAGYDNTNPNLSFNQQFGNEEASVTSSVLFPGKIPFAVYAEYAGEDTSRGRSYLLGNSALSVGIHFPRLWNRFDFTYEVSEWQNVWYVHSVYGDGMTNYGHVVGHWFGDQRVYNDGVGGQSHMLRLAWDATFGGLVELRYRTLQNQVYGVIPYHRFQDLTLGYSRPVQGVIVGGQIEGGRDVFGASFSRVAGFVRYNDLREAVATSLGGAGEGSGESERKGEIFVDAGLNSYRVRTDLTDEDHRTTSPRKSSGHFALGARRNVTEHVDLGTRLELDDIEGHSLLGVRLLDYRYRTSGPLAFDIFLGAARYALATPAYGFYYGAGAQWRNVLPGWDLGVDFRYNDSVARDHLLPSDPQSVRPDSFYDIWGGTVSVSYHF